MFAYVNAKKGEKRAKIIMSILKLRALLVSAQKKIKYKKNSLMISLHAHLFARRQNKRNRNTGVDGKHC